MDFDEKLEKAVLKLKVLITQGKWNFQRGHYHALC